MTATEIRRPGGWLRAALGDLLMGARMAFTGGREGWTRTALTALGVGVGVAMLLLAAAAPGAIDARADRTAARSDWVDRPDLPAAANTFLIAPVDTGFRGTFVRGRIVHAEGPNAPVPPGLAAFPRDGEAVVSPALRALLDSPDGPLFAPRLGGARVTGTIGPEGLSGPHELAFYLGHPLSPDRGMRLDHFGDSGPGEQLSPLLWLLVVVVFVVLLLPIVVFLGAAVRFGGEQRDRRLAALRLLGADTGMVRRIAAAEAGTAALFGLAVGALLFLAGRQLAPLVSLYDISVFPGDLSPAPWLAALVALAVPLLAAVVALLALRGVLVTPLGVSRRATPARRRLWWRLLLPAAGLALLRPLAGVGAAGSDMVQAPQVTAGAVLLLVGTVALLPWLVDLLVRRLRGGPPPWQLATRRLQLDSAASARLVSGVAVAVAGTIGLQMLVAGVQDQFRERTGQDPTRAQVAVSLYNLPEPGKALAQVAAVPGVTRSVGTLQVMASPHTKPAGQDESEVRLAEVLVGDCATLAEHGDLGSCSDGDVFLIWPDDDPIAGISPGARLSLGDDAVTWQVPANARTVPVRNDPMGARHIGLLVTPGAMPSLPPGATAHALLSLDPRDPDAMERVRAEVAGMDLFASVNALTEVRENSQFANVRRGLLAGAVVTLLLIGVSMLVGVLEQLRERRRLLAALVAVGTPRSTLGWSVLGQTGVPVLAGLVLATGIGVAMGAALLKMVGAPVVVSWPVVGLGVGLGAAVVLLVTLASLPMLWRLTRPDGLRFE